jgi:hypothetical protein
MDQEQFDHLARGLASGITRRGMVCSLTGAALGGVLAVVGPVRLGPGRPGKGRGSAAAIAASSRANAPRAAPNARARQKAIRSRRCRSRQRAIPPSAAST